MIKHPMSSLIKPFCPLGLSPHCPGCRSRLQRLLPCPERGRSASPLVPTRSEGSTKSLQNWAGWSFSVVAVVLLCFGAHPLSKQGNLMEQRQALLWNSLLQHFETPKVQIRVKGSQATV